MYYACAICEKSSFAGDACGGSCKIGDIMSSKGCSLSLIPKLNAILHWAILHSHLFSRAQPKLRFCVKGLGKGADGQGAKQLAESRICIIHYSHFDPHYHRCKGNCSWRMDKMKCIITFLHSCKKGLLKCMKLEVAFVRPIARPHTFRLHIVLTHSHSPAEAPFTSL